MNRGAVVHVKIPNVGRGREQEGDRFGIIVQPTAQLANLSTALVVPTTGNVAAVRFPGACAIGPSTENGLPGQSIALAHQCRVVDKSYISEPLGQLSPHDLARVEEGLRAVLGL